MRKTFSAVVIAAGATWLACSEATAPTGKRGSLTVTAYVDADATGSLTASDIVLPDFAVALTRDGVPVTTGQTGANGKVTFSDLPPGSYQVEARSAAPMGSALASNPSPTAVISFQGTSASVDFRFVYFPGSITGNVFRDDNGSGAFEAGADTPGAGLWVFLRADVAGAAGAKLDSVRTDANGFYSFARVAPGSYYLEFQNPSTIDFGPSGATRRVVVSPRQATSMNAIFTGSLIISIAEARTKALGSAVAVVGNLTAPPGVFKSGTGGVNSELWVQDATGGIAIFSLPTNDSLTLALGDRVEVSGTLGQFSGQLQIGSPRLTELTGNTIVAAKTVTGAEVNARTDEGRLVRSTGLMVDSIKGGSSQDTVFTTAPDGNIVRIQLAAGPNANFTRSVFAIGSRYTVTGLLTQRNTVARIKPRYATDIVLESVVPSPVARLVINELMPDPTAVADGSGEWLEIHNWGAASADLQGWKLFGNSVGDTARITSSLVVAPGGYVVLGNNGDMATNGGVQVDYVYTLYSLNNSTTTGDVVVLRDAAGMTVDSVVYVSPPIGASMALKDPSSDNTNAKGPNWQTSTTPYNASDEGTPSAQNDGYIPPTPPLPAISAGDQPTDRRAQVLRDRTMAARSERSPRTGTP